MEKRFETLKEIDEYAMKNALTDEERRGLFERRMQYFSEYANGVGSWASNLPFQIHGHHNNAKASYRIGLMTHLLSKQVAARNARMTK